MEIHKIAHEVCQVSNHWHLSLFGGLTGFITVTPKLSGQLNYSDLGDVPGDNILQNEISLSSRGGL